MTKIRSIPAFWLVVCCALTLTQVASSQAPEGQNEQQQEGVVSISTTIKGNQEQPKVLYIVPWQAAVDDGVLTVPMHSQMKQIFRHVEQPEHTRELELRQKVNQTEKSE